MRSKASKLLKSPRLSASFLFLFTFLPLSNLLSGNLNGNLELKVADIDFGKIYCDDLPKSFEVKATNISGQVLTITGAKASCDCVTVSLERAVLRPMESCSFRLFVDSSADSGSFNTAYIVRYIAHSITGESGVLAKVSGLILPVPKPRLRAACIDSRPAFESRDSTNIEIQLPDKDGEWRLLDVKSTKSQVKIEKWSSIYDEKTHAQKVRVIFNCEWPQDTNFCSPEIQLCFGNKNKQTSCFVAILPDYVPGMRILQSKFTKTDDGKQAFCYISIFFEEKEFEKLMKNTLTERRPSDISPNEFGKWETKIILPLPYAEDDKVVLTRILLFVPQLNASVERLIPIYGNPKLRFANKLSFQAAMSDESGL